MRQIKIGILGAGTMGKQLSLLFSANRMPVTLWNYRRQPNFKYDFDRLAAIQAKCGCIPAGKVGEVVGRVDYTNDISELSGCELILEAVKEDKTVKTATFKKLVRAVPEIKIVATNTSTLSVSDLAEATGQPSRFIGLHFFNPPMTMELVEVVKCKFTSDTTLSDALKILAKLGKQPIVLPDTPGFVVNRLLLPMINEAILLLAEGGTDAKTIDSCMRFGAKHPMGPLELADFIGLDICMNILATLAEETGNDRYRPAQLLIKHVSSGQLGRKTGNGFYNYAKK